MIYFPRRTGTVQIHLRHSGGERDVRQLVVSSQRTVATAEGEIAEESAHQAERIPTGVHADLQTDSQIHDRRLRGRASGRQQEEKSGCADCTT